MCSFESTEGHPGPDSTKGFAAVFGLLIVVLGVISFTDESRLLRAGVSLALVLVVTASVRAAGFDGRRSRALLAVAGLLALMVVASGISDLTALTVAATVGVAGSLSFAAYALIRRIVQHAVVGVGEVIAALTAYLQVALAFAFLHLAAARATSEAFFTQGLAGQLSDFAYFSVVTITSLGFGDLTPATDLGRSLVMIETILGQIILVVLVAYLVGRLDTPSTRSGA